MVVRPSQNLPTNKPHTPALNRKKPLDRKRAGDYAKHVFAGDLHEKRIESLANATTGALSAARFSVQCIGTAYAATKGLRPKHGIKQVDRFLANEGIDLDKLLPSWMAHVVGCRENIVIALDWTDFDADGQMTLVAAMITSHGRATPLCWKTVLKSTLKGNQVGYEEEMVEQIHRAIPDRVNVTLLADRGFGSKRLYGLLEFYGWDYVIRFRGNIRVETEDGESRTASEWATPRAKVLRNARITSERFQVPGVVVVHAPRMKEAWCLATSFSDKPATYVKKLYGKRFTIEETFRDQKDPRFGRGLSECRIKKPEKRDRLLLVAAVAMALLTLLGQASEETGLDRFLKANTSKKRTHSLFRQGSYWYDAMINAPDEWIQPLMEAFDRIVREQRFFTELYGSL